MVATNEPQADSSSTPPRARLQRLTLSLTSQPLLGVLALFHAIFVAPVMLTHWMGLEGVLSPEGKVVTGDFLNHYIGGRMIYEGRGTELYDAAAQLEIQAKLTGPDYPHQHWFLNPPLYACFLAALAPLPYLAAFYTFGVIMVVLMVATLWMVKPTLPELARTGQRWGSTVLLAAFFFPVLWTMLGGQNTVLTIFLLTGMYVALRSRASVLAGIFLGLLSYKPQFVPLLGVLLLIRGDLRAVCAAAITGILHYLLGAACCGYRWPRDFLAAVEVYQPWEKAHNFHTHFSFMSVCQYSLSPPFDSIIWIGATCVVVVLLLRSARRYAAASPAFGVYWAMVMTAALVISPHTQYYDVGILIIPMMIGVDYTLQTGVGISARARAMILIAYLTVSLFIPYANTLGRTLHFQPLVLGPILTLVWLTSLLQTQQKLHPARAKAP